MSGRFDEHGNAIVGNVAIPASLVPAFRELLKPRRAYNPPRYRCGAPCHYGGSSAARKHSRAELGLWGACNRPVRTEDERCHAHQSSEPERGA